MFKESSKSRGVCRTQANIYDAAFLRIYLTDYFFFNKSLIIEVRLGCIYASENIEIFKLEPRWSKSSLLLQRMAFLVKIVFTHSVN